MRVFRDLVLMTGLPLDQAIDQVTSNNPLYAVENVEVRGVPLRAFQNIPGTMRALLQSAVQAHQDAEGPYLTYHAETWSFEEFHRDVNALSAILVTEFGVTKGQPVAIAMRNCPELLMLILAISSIGGVAVFLNAWWTTDELDYALRDSAARLVFADGRRFERLEPLIGPLGLSCVAVRDAQSPARRNFPALDRAESNFNNNHHDIETDDDLFIMYSSGTTGHPKGVVQTHRGAMNAVYTWLMQSELAPLTDPPPADAPPPPTPCFLVATPLFHVTATHPVFLLSLPAGARLVVMDKWDADEAVRLIEREKVTRMIGVPAQCADLMEAADRLGARLETLDFLGAGGAKRPAAQVGNLAQRFPNAQIATGWGMTETNANGIGLAGPQYVDNPGVAGRLYPPVQELRFLDETGSDVGPGEIGEITVKSPCNMRCYLNKPEETEAVLKDGWLRTGDLGFIDGEGLVTIVDRKKNIIIRGGENISCLDVEGALHRHPAVAEACAFAVPHDRLGEVVGVGIMVSPGHSATGDMLRTFLADHIAHFKIPEHFWFFTKPLPRGATDKFDKRGLRALCLQSQTKEALNS